jgi:hypothetical protein
MSVLEFGNLDQTRQASVLQIFSQSPQCQGHSPAGKRISGLNSQSQIAYPHWPVLRVAPNSGITVIHRSICCQDFCTAAARVGDIVLQLPNPQMLEPFVLSGQVPLVRINMPVAPITGSILHLLPASVFAFVDAYLKHYSQYDVNNKLRSREDIVRDLMVLDCEALIAVPQAFAHQAAANGIVTGVMTPIVYEILGVLGTNPVSAASMGRRRLAPGGELFRLIKAFFFKKDEEDERFDSTRLLASMMVR